MSKNAFNPSARSLGQAGSMSLLGVLVFGLVGAAVVTSFIPINRQYNDGKSNVAGVYATGSSSYAKTAESMGGANFKIASDAGQTAVVEKRVGALSTFPLTVNPKTNELTVTTTNGAKVVTVLPQQAVDNMLASKVMTDVVSEEGKSTLASIPSLVKLEVKNDVLGYSIKGTKTNKLLGLIPIKTSVEAFVSAENGKVVETNQSLFGKILNKISF